MDPSSIKDWSSLNDAVAKVVASGHKGITFSGIAGEEGVFQFLPWFWGAGASLKDPGSSQAAEAGQLVGGWVAKGYAPKSAATDNQSASWDQFLTGDYGFAENGSWFAKAATQQKFSTGLIAIPSKAGGAAPVPTGGEFAVAPLHKANADGHAAAAKAVIDCLLGSKSQVKTDDALGYFTASKSTREQQLSSTSYYAPWADSITNAQGRTTDLGAAYTTTSAAISTALQTALNNGSDASAVTTAFKQAGQAAKG